MLKDDIKKALPKTVGKVFRDISGKGPERIYINLVANMIVVYVTGYITSGLENSRLFDDISMRKATETYYNKLSHNSLEFADKMMLSECGIHLETVMSDFNVKQNLGVIMYGANKILTEHNDLSDMSSSYHNFLKNRLIEFMLNSTGGYPKSIDMYLVSGDLFIFMRDFLGRFNEMKYRFDKDLIEANRAFYYGILKGEFVQHIEDFETDELKFCNAFCDVSIMNDNAMIILKGAL